MKKHIKKIGVNLLIAILIFSNMTMNFPKAENAGTTTTWIGGTDSSWSESTNWSDGVPQSTVDIVLDGTTNSVITLDGSSEALVGGVAAVYNLSTANGPITINMINNPTLMVNRDMIADQLTINGTGTLRVGERGASPYAGNCTLTNSTIGNGITIDVSGDLNLDHTVTYSSTVGGTLSMSSSSGNSSTITGSLIMVDSSMSYRVYNVGGNATLTQGSSLQTVDSITGNLSATNSTITSLFHVTGNLDAINSTITMQSSGSIGGLVTLTSTALLNGRLISIGDDVSVTDSQIVLSQNGGNTLSIQGDITASNSTLTMSSGSLTVNGKVDLTNTSQLTNSGYTLQITGITNVDSTSHMTLNACYANFASDVAFAVGSTLTMSGYNHLTLQADFINDGSLIGDVNYNQVTASNGTVKLNNEGTPLFINYLTTNQVVFENTDLEFIRSDSAGFSHTGALTLTNSKIDALKLRTDQITYANQTITINNGSDYFFEAIGKFSDANGNIVSSIDNGSSVYVTIEDMNRSLTSGQDTIQVTVESPSGDSEVITLTETTGTSGVFINTAPLAASFAADNTPNNGTLHIAAKDENITASYLDGAESLNIQLIKPYIVWNGSVSRDWYTTGNWDGGKVPNSTDNVLISGIQGPYVTTTLSVLAFDTTPDFSGTIQLYGSATSLESIKLQSGNLYISSELTLNQDLYAHNAGLLNVYGYNNSQIKGKIDVDHMDSSVTITSNSSYITVDKPIEISNVSGSVTLNYLECIDTLNIHDNQNVSLRYSHMNDVAVLTTNASVGTYDNQFIGILTLDKNTDLNLQYDWYKADFAIIDTVESDNSTRQIYESNFDQNATFDMTNRISVSYSDFENLDLDGVDADFYDNYFGGSNAVIALSGDLDYSYNDLAVVDPVTITADSVSIGRENSFRSDLTVTGTTIDFTGSANNSYGTKDWTYYNNAEITFVGSITGDPSVAMNLNDATVNFPLNASLELIDLKTYNTSSLKNLTVTLNRDEYAYFTNSGSLTLDNSNILADNLMTDDISQTGALNKANGSTYSTQGQGYFGDADGNLTSDIGNGTLYFYLYDHDKNITTAPDTITVHINNNGAAYVLTETGNSTGLFAASINPIDVDPSLYIDYEGRRNAYVATPYVWDGGAGDSLWYSAANWVGDVVPLEFDSVLIDNSDETIAINDITRLQDLVLGDNFTGSLRRNQGSLTTENLTIQSGTLADTGNYSHPFSVHKNFTVNSGTVTRTTTSSWNVTQDALFHDASVSIYNLTVNGDAVSENSTLTISNGFYITKNFDFDGTYNGGTLSIGSNGKLTFNNGTAVVNTLDNNGLFDFNNGKLTTQYLYQDKDMNQLSGEILVHGNCSFVMNSLFTLKSGKFTVDNQGNVGSFGKITMDGGTFDAFGYGTFNHDLNINSGKMKINSKGNNYTSLLGDIHIGEYGNLAFGSNIGWSGYYFYGDFLSIGNYSFGNMTYLILNNGVNFDLQNKLLEVYSLNISNNATIALTNGTVKVKNQAGSTFTKNSGSVLSLTNAKLDVSRSYNFNYIGGSINLDGSSQFIRKTSGMNIVDANGNVAPHIFTFGNTLYFLVEDDSANLNASAAETMDVLYKNFTSNEEETVTLTEIANNSKKFIGSIQSAAIELGDAATQAGIAEGSNGRGTNKVLNFKDQILLRYIDTKSERGNDIFEVAFNAAKMALGSTNVDIDATSMDFGINYVEEFKTSNIVIYNRGDITLTVDELSIEGDENANFKFAGSGASRIYLGNPIKVAPKSQVSLPMVFEATTPGEKTAALKLKSNDIENSTLSMNMVGVAGYRPQVVQEKVDAACYSATVNVAGLLPEQTIDLSEFFVGRNNAEPLTIRVSGNSNTSLFDTFTYNSNTHLLSYHLDSNNNIATLGKATISVEATDSLGFVAETSFGINIYEQNNADLLKLNLLDTEGNSVGEWSYTFDTDTLDYYINVPVSLGSAVIDATAVNPNAEVTGDGATAISMGNNTKTVTVVSEDTTVSKAYVLHITREAATFTSSGANQLIYETGNEYNSIAIDESIRVNGAQKIDVYFTSGFITGQDALVYELQQGSNVTASYDDSIGKLTLTGNAQSTAKEYNDILKTIRYQNNGTTATSGNRGVRFNLYYDNAIVSTLNRTITVNNPPVAVEQTFLHIAQSGNLVRDLNISDADNDNLTIEIVTQPLMESDNTVALNGKTFTYTPKNGVYGLDSFVYRVYDGKSYSDYSTVTINLVDINNQGLAPDVLHDKVDEANYLENDIDGFEHDTMTIDLSTLFFGKNNGDPLSFKIVSVSDPELFESFVFDEATSTLTYTIAKNDSKANIGSSDIEIEAMDSIGYFANATLNANVVAYMDSDEDGIPNDKDSDDDNDSVIDADDPFPLDPNLPFFDGDKDGIPDIDDTDDDNDGIIDAIDTDDDNDGILDGDDSDPTNPDLPYYDGDKDGIPDYQDPDDDNDGIPDVDDPDDDNDGILDVDDSDPTNPNMPYSDYDHDGVWSNDDVDSDNDGLNDSIDPDDDNDGVIDTEDLSPKNPNIPYLDGDKDSIPDYLDPDDDNDGIPDVDDPDDDNDGVNDDKDLAPTNPDIPHYDGDKDGTPDYLDLDDDNDGIPDVDDPDDDNDGIIDTLDPVPTNPDIPYYDGDKDGTPDYLDPDDDNDGIPDVDDPDDDNDGVIDTLDIAPTNPDLPYYDGDKDGIPDYLDPNDDNDGIPDVDDPDDDNDGIADDKDIAPTNPNIPIKEEAPKDPIDLNTVLDEALSTVKIGYIQGDSSTHVTGNVILPITSVDSLGLNWSSNKVDIINTSGTVVRQLSDTVVKLTVRIEKDGYFRTKDFYLTVKGTALYNENTDKQNLEILYVDGDNATSVTKDVFLTKKGTTGGIISWSSNMPGVVSNSGKVVRPGPSDGDVAVTMTATIEDPDTHATTTKQFIINVVKLSDKEATEEAARNLSISDAAIFAPGDIWESVTENFILLQTGSYGTDITWTSNNTSVIDIQKVNGDITGAVHRTAADVKVIITATISLGSESSTKSFLLLVKSSTVTKDINNVRQDSLRTADLGESINGIETTETTVIYRTELSDGTLIDTVVIESEDFDNLAANMDPNDSDPLNRTAVIVIDEPVNDAADEYAIEIQAGAISTLADKNAQLKIETPVATIFIEESSLQEVADEGTDLYFRVRPITDDSEKNNLVYTIMSDSSVTDIMPEGQIAKVISTPMKIETNMNGVTTTIRVPLEEIKDSIPTTSAEDRDAFLESLSIFVAHSDGENKVYTPTIIYDDNGEAIALEFVINKFSSFQIIQPQAAPVVVTTTSSGGSVIGTLSLSQVREYAESKDLIQVSLSGSLVVLKPDAIDLQKVSEFFGNNVDEKDIIIELEKTVLFGSQLSELQQLLNKQGMQMSNTPFIITIKARYGTKELALELKKAMSITCQADAGKKITTALLIDGQKIYHQPTFVTIQNGTYQAQINSFETGVFVLIWQQITFNDIKDHWSMTSIENMASREIIFGNGLNQAEPNRPISRAEFVAMLMRSLGFLPTEVKVPFKDVQSTSWYNEVISTAVAMNLIQGYGDNTFRPEATITRQEAITIIGRAMGLVELRSTLSETEKSTLLRGFTDYSLVKSWAMEAVKETIATEILVGRDSNLAVDQKITRAEAAVLLERMLKKSKFID